MDTMDELEAVKYAQNRLEHADTADIDEMILIEREVLRALLARATRAHD